MTIEEVRGYMNGILETLDGDIPRKLFKKIAKMMDRVETTKIVTGGTTIIGDYYPPRRWYWWCDNNITWCDDSTSIPADITVTYSSSEDAYKALGSYDARDYTAG